MTPPSQIEVRVAGVLVRDDKVLLVRHDKPVGSYWVVPGGRVGFGETLPDALRREFVEELSMDIRVDSLAFLNDAAPADKARHVVNVYFQVSCDDELVPGKLQEVAEARFFAAEDIGDIDLRPSIGAALLEVMNCGLSKDAYLGNLWP